MPKKEKKSASFASFSSLPYVGFLLILFFASWWMWQSPAIANWKDRVLKYVDNSNIVTLEAHFLPEQILETHRSDLLNHDKKILQNTTLKYYPYLLLDVKYPELSKTREGVLLWSLKDGEMVLNTETWEITHGFRDCLECQASKQDFKILRALAGHAGSMNVEDLQKDLKVERDVLDVWLEEAKQKYLIVQKGQNISLHFENPKLLVTPQTKIKQHLVSKPLGEGQKISRLYSHNQIIALTQAAFGNEFNIRHEQEIFLPVYSLEILNPDGSIQISEWNALTGQRIIPYYLSKI